MNRYLITSILFGSIIMMTLSQGLLADEIKHKFKNPSFSGIGSGAHYLTIENQESRIYAQMAKQLVESMFSNDNPVRFGSFVLEGSTVTYEVITNEDGTEFIRMTIIDQEGSSTVIEIPIGTGYFGDDGSGSSDGDGGG